MKLPEQRLWSRARVNLAAHKVWMERVENLVSVGTPDVHGVARGRAFWMENKAVDAAPARATTALLRRDRNLSREQINWHVDYTRMGGNSFVLIGVGSHEAFLLPGALAPKINDMTYTAVTVAACARVARPADWEHVARMLGGVT